MSAGEVNAPELAGRLEAVRARIAAACRAAGRTESAVTLIAVTKGHPVTSIQQLVDLGVRDFGESRDQEAREKAAALPGYDLRWHFVGQLQRNKAASVAGYAALVHTVDRLQVASALAASAAPRFRECGRRLPVLLQVNLDDPARAVGRGGVSLGELRALAAVVTDLPSLELQGLMGIAPRSEPPQPAFEALAVAAEELRAEYPNATVLSAGMSADLELAVAAGATHVRVGTAVLGQRPELR